MSEMRFFERLRALEADPGRRGRQNSDAVLKSIIWNLGKILNTRKGTVLLDPDFGLPDYTNFGASFSEETIGVLRRSMEKLVRRYEPRIQQLRIQPHQVLPDELELAFDIVGVVSMEDGALPVNMKTYILCNGEVRIARQEMS